MKAYKPLLINIFAFIGAISILFVSAIAIFWTNLNTTSGLDTPLEKNWSTQRYFSEVDERPLIKSELVQVVEVRALNETPKSTTLEILYDSPDDAAFEDVWISAYMLEDSGYPSTYYHKPAKAHSGHGKIAIVEFGIADSATEDITHTNMVKINFYSTKTSIFHEARYEYERVWCRNSSEVEDLWKEAYPKEQGSKYSLNSARSLSRLCLNRF